MSASKHRFAPVSVPTGTNYAHRNARPQARKNTQKLSVCASGRGGEVTMNKAGHKLQGLCHTLFDAMPAMVFIVDEDLRIQEYNLAASQHIQAERSAVLQRRAGNVLRCVHGKRTPGGCGSGVPCQHCPVRKSVGDAFDGLAIRNIRTQLVFSENGSTTEQGVYVSAYPIQLGERHLVLLVLQLATESPKSNRMIPMCSVCRQVRDQDGQWQRVESYFQKNWNVSFSHGLCPNCEKQELAKVGEGAKTKAETLPGQNHNGPDREPGLPADPEQRQPAKKFDPTLNALLNLSRPSRS